MVKNLVIRAISTIIIAVVTVFYAAPALAQEEGGGDAGETPSGGSTGGTPSGGGGGTAGVKEESGVKATKLSTGEYEFEETIIEGRLEKPVALFIKRQQPEFKTVRFARDFWDDILRPIDKEEFERAMKEKTFDYVKNPLLWLATATAVTSAAAAGYQTYNQEWGQVKVFGITAGASAAAAGVLILIDHGRNRAAR